MTTQVKIALRKTTAPKAKPFGDLSGPLGFGQYFADHMFVAKYQDKKWQDLSVVPYEPLQLDPGASVLHYGQALFEGMKAFRQKDGKVGLFRPEFNWKRMNFGAERLCMQMPTLEVFLHGLKQLVALDQDWVPNQKGSSLYLRPTLIGTEGFLGVRPSTEYLFFIITSPVSSYYAEGTAKPVKIWIEERDSRAGPGGLGNTKAAANYASSLRAALHAKENGYAQVLWLDSTKTYVEEVGTMNVFFRINDEVVTPSLSGTILEGGTRECVLELVKSYGAKVTERPIELKEILTSARDGSLKEVFGTGTAAVITPVGEFGYRNEHVSINNGQPGEMSSKLYEDITKIQYGEASDSRGWITLV